MAEDAWNICTSEALLDWMKLSRATGSVQQAICAMMSLYCTTTMNRDLLCCANQGFCYSNLAGITKFRRQHIKGRTKWIIVVEEEVVKWNRQANGSLGPKTNRYEIIMDSNSSDMSKKNWNVQTVEDW